MKITYILLIALIALIASIAVSAVRADNDDDDNDPRGRRPCPVWTPQNGWNPTFARRNAYSIASMAGAAVPNPPNWWLQEVHIVPQQEDDTWVEAFSFDYWQYNSYDVVSGNFSFDQYWPTVVDGKFALQYQKVSGYPLPPSYRATPRGKMIETKITQYVFGAVTPLIAASQVILNTEATNVALNAVCEISSYTSNVNGKDVFSEVIDVVRPNDFRTYSLMQFDTTEPITDPIVWVEFDSHSIAPTPMIQAAEAARAAGAFTLMDDPAGLAYGLHYPVYTWILPTAAQRSVQNSAFNTTGFANAIRYGSRMGSLALKNAAQ